MAQTLPDISIHPLHPASHRKLNAQLQQGGLENLDTLIQTMDHYLALAKAQTLKPRQEAVAFILKKAAELN